MIVVYSSGIALNAAPCCFRALAAGDRSNDDAAQAPCSALRPRLHRRADETPSIELARFSAIAFGRVFCIGNSKWWRAGARNIDSKIRCVLNHCCETSLSVRAPRNAKTANWVRGVVGGLPLIELESQDTQRGNFDVVMTCG